MLTKIAYAVASLLTIYVGLFGAWAMLILGCVQQGYTPAECHDNALSRVVRSLYPYLFDEEV